MKLSQREMAELLGVSFDRIKNIRSGKVRALTQSEAETLVKKLHIRGDWLATGEGPMFQSDQEKAFHGNLDKLSEITNKVISLDLSKREMRTLHDILSALETENVEWLKQYLTGPLNQQEKELISNYRASSPRVQTLILHMSKNLLPDDIHKFKAPKHDET